MRKISVLFLCFLFLHFFSFSKNKEEKELDSLVHALGKPLPDSVQLKSFKRILDLCELEDNAKYAKLAIHYTDSLIARSTDSTKIKSWLGYKAKYLEYYAVFYSGALHSDYLKAVEYNLQIISINKKIGDIKGVAAAYSGIGNIYLNHKEHKMANNYFNLALKTQIKIEDFSGAAMTHFLIGNNFYTDGNALEGYFNYYLAILSKNEATHKKANEKNHITEISNNNFLEVQAEARSYTSGIIGLLCGFLFSLGILHLFLFMFHSSGKSNLYYSLYALVSAGVLYILLFKFCYNDAELSFLTSSFFQEILSSGAYLLLILFLYSLFYPKPLKFIYVLISLYVLYILFYRFNQTVSSVIIVIFRITAFVELIRVVIKAKIKKKEGARLFAIWMWLSLAFFFIIFFTIFLIVQKVVMAGSTNLSLSIIYFLAIIFCLTYLNFSIVMSIFLARQVAKTNKGLEKQITENKQLSEKMLEQEIEKKKFLESQNEQLESMVTLRTAELQKQKEIVEEKNQEILDSITYAQGIQNALLPSAAEIQKVFPQSFILFKPKDIVSGDFYWFYNGSENEERRAESENPNSVLLTPLSVLTAPDSELIFIAVADCTGHGVPGAFMSTIAYEKLNEALSRKPEVSAILQTANRTIRKVLHQTGMENATRDGMDVIICSFNKQMTQLSYAGANRPFWIVRSKESGVGSDEKNNELTEIKATKTAIGGLTEDDQEFTSHTVNLHKGDTIYLFTDGYPDQFSPEDKKLMTKKFKEILLSIANLNMEQQKTYLENFIENWRGTMEQTDDMLVIGIRI